MNKKHLALILTGCLALSSSTFAMAEGKSKEARSKHHANGKVLAPSTPITLSAASGIVRLDTSTVVPLVHFDTSTATTHTDMNSDDGGVETDHHGNGNHETSNSSHDDD